MRLWMACFAESHLGRKVFGTLVTRGHSFSRQGHRVSRKHVVGQLDGLDERLGGFTPVFRQGTG